MLPNFNISEIMDEVYTNLMLKCMYTIKFPLVLDLTDKDIQLFYCQKQILI